MSAVFLGLHYTVCLFFHKQTSENFTEQLDLTNYEPLLKGSGGNGFCWGCDNESLKFFEKKRWQQISSLIRCVA